MDRHRAYGSANSSVTTAPSTAAKSTKSEAINSFLLKKVQFAQQDSMSTKTSSSKSVVRLPVVVVPAELTFIADDPSSHKQTVSIYNPYDFAIRYKVFGTAPAKYQMPEDSGSIGPCTYRDITIRMTDISEANCGVTDKFRIVIWDLASSDHLQGERELRSMLVASREALASEKDVHGNRSGALRHSLRKTLTEPPSISSTSAKFGMQPRDEELRVTNSKQGPSFFVLLIALLCIVALSVPTSNSSCTEKEENRHWAADYVTLSLNQKLVAAYVLGLVTVTLFKSC